MTEKVKDLNYLPQGYELDSVIPARNKKDPSMNEYGQQLTDLCIEAKRRVLRRKTFCDFQGLLIYTSFYDCSTR